MRGTRRFRPLKIGDIIIIILFLILPFIFPKRGGQKVQIFVDGKLIHTYSLDMDTLITIRGYRGPATFQIKRGKVRMVNSTCPLKLCVKMGWIDKAGSSIICVPNRVLIKIAGKKNYDAITE